MGSRTPLGPGGPSGTAPSRAGGFGGADRSPAPSCATGDLGLGGVMPPRALAAWGRGPLEGDPPLPHLSRSRGSRLGAECGVCCSNPRRRRAPRPRLRGSRATPSQTRKSLWLVEPNPFPQDYPDLNPLHPEHINGIEKPRPTARKTLAAHLKTLYLGNTPASASQATRARPPSALGRRPGGAGREGETTARILQVKLSGAARPGILLSAMTGFCFSPEGVSGPQLRAMATCPIC